MAGGSIQSININNRYFSVTASDPINRKLGGFENEIETNGDGTGRTIKSRVSWSQSGIVVACEDSRGDHEYLQSISDSVDLVPISVTYVDGSVYQGNGIITGELSFSSDRGTAGFDVMGTGKLTKQ